jgi:hypothetical protein
MKDLLNDVFTHPLEFLAAFVLVAGGLFFVGMLGR